VPVGFFISRPLAQLQTQFLKEIAKATKFSQINLNFLLSATFVGCLGCSSAALQTYGWKRMKGKTNVT
jgi:hypothetical protein